MMKDPNEIAQRMDALNIWDVVIRYNWAIKPHRTLLPYFCTIWKGAGDLARYRFLILEGWQTFHDFIHTRIDNNFGFYSSPIELPHYEVVFLKNGKIKLFRHDPGYLPRELTENELSFLGRILWEAYGVMMRIESENNLVLKYSNEKAMFSRVEISPDVWEDAPLKIPEPRPYVEQISFEKKDISLAKDLPLDSKEIVELDFRFIEYGFSNTIRKRVKYILLMFDVATNEKQVIGEFMVSADVGLKELWEGVPSKFLKFLISRGRIPGEIKLVSGRLFRMLRPLGNEIPFKLSLHESLKNIENAYNELQVEARKK